MLGDMLLRNKAYSCGLTRMQDNQGGREWIGFNVGLGVYKLSIQPNDPSSLVLDTQSSMAIYHNLIVIQSKGGHWLLSGLVSN